MIEPRLPSREQIANCRVLIVGDVMLDRYWLGDVTRISPEAPVPVVHIGSEEYRLGGAANVALNARALGARVTLMGIVGRDKNADILQKLLTNHEIQSELVEDLTIDTTSKLRIMGRGQQIVRVDFEKVPDPEVSALMPERFQNIVQEYDVVLFSDYGKGSLAHINIMIQIARAYNKPIFVDPKGVNWERYIGSSLVTPNKAELAQVIGPWINDEELHEKVRVLCMELALQGLLVTRSEEGMTLFEGSHVSSVPAMTREVADVSGAGDTVISTISIMVACGLKLGDAMIIANRAAGLVVAKFGTASLTYEELHG